MKYAVTVIAMMLLLSCKHDFVPPIEEPEETGPVDTNYFDSLVGTFTGEGWIYDDYKQLRKDYQDNIGVTIKNNEVYTISSEFNLRFIVPDTMKKQPKFSVSQSTVFQQEILEVDFTRKTVPKSFIKVTVFKKDHTSDKQDWFWITAYKN